MKPRKRCSPKTTTSPAAGDGSTPSPVARQEMLAEMSPDSSYPLRVSWVSRDLPQLAEIVRFDAGAAAAAAAMSTTEPKVFFPLAALECLGAMVRERCARVREEEHVRAEEEDEVEAEKGKVRFGPHT